MKLHLPQSLRGALLACFASVAGLTTTLATGAFVGGVFYVSLSQVAQAADVAVTTNTTWTNADAATHADDTVTVGDAAAEDAITLQVGQGGTNALTAGRSIDFGTVTVNAGDTLKLHIWTTKAADNLATQMVTINSAITLNNAGILLEDGAYNFAESITINGESTLSVNWDKGTILTSIVGDENAVLKLVRNGNANGWDQRPALIELTKKNENFRGTVKLADQFSQYDGVGLKLVISNAEALINAVLDLGENDDAALRIRTQRALLKAIKGHGFIEYSPLDGQASSTEIVVSAAQGNYAGSSAANVNWTISGGNQGLNNASILGTYTVEEAASSTFSGNVTLGSLVNNSAAGIDVANLTHLNIVDRTVGNGSALNLGTLSGYSADSTFTYGNGWTATWQEDGTASISTDHIFWNDNGTDGNTNWSDASNWAGPNADTYTVQSTDTVYLHAVAAGKTVTLTEDVTVAGLRVEGDYAFAVAQGGSYTLTAPITLTSGKTFTKSGAGTLKLPNASGLLGKNITVEAGVLDITEGVDLNGGDNTQADYTVTVKSGAKLKDDRRLGLTGNTVTITGGGIYELSEMVLSREDANAVTLNVKEGTVLYVTGTYNSGDTGRDQTGKKGGSFMLGNWTCTNILNVHGVLAAEAGISLATGGATLNIESGGVLQMNAGLKTTASSGTATIHVKNGGALVVKSANTGGEDKMTVNMQDGSTVFAIDNATIAEPLAYASSGTVKLGAAADKILSLTATTPNVGTITILGTGDTVKTFANDTVSNTAAGGTVRYTNTVSGTAITLNAGAKFEAAAGLNLSGALTLAANSEAKLWGAVTVGSIANSGTIDVSELQSLRLGADSGSMGATVNLGTVSSYTAGNTFTYGNGWTATWQDNGTALITGDSAIAWADTGAEGDTDINWNTADNWSGATAPTATDYVQLAATEGVTRTLALTADTTVAGLRVYDAYTLSVGEGTTAAFTATNGIELNGDTAKLSKAGTGTLSMTSVQAIAAKMSVTEGTLKLTDTLASAPLNTVTAQDLSALSSSASGVLAVTAGGAARTPGASSNNNNQGPTVSAISLADSFTGAVEVLGGKLSVTKSNLGGTSLLHLNGGGLLVSSNGSAFATQALAYNLHVGVNGGYLDHYGGSTAKEDSWSSKHTGTMTGSGVLTLIGYGEWMFAGTYTNFTGSIEFGNQAQRVYLSSDMTGLTGLLATATEVAVGYKSAEDSAVSVVVSGKETLSGNRTMYFANGSTFTHSGGVEVAAGQTLSVQRYTSGQTGTFNAANVELAAGSGDTAAAIFSVGTGIEANLTSTAAYTATAGTISIASDATVNDSRALTIDGAYNISGAGAYNQLGSLALTSNGALTLSGVVSINSLAGNNAGTITFADTLTSLELKDFTLGADYNIGTVTNGENVDWGTLLGYDSGVDFSYADGILSSVSLGAISWGSPADEDITWGGANWKTANGSELISISSTDSVVLDVIDTSAETPVSPTIELAADTTVAGLVVNDAYYLSIAEGATYSFAADSYAFGANGSLSKTGAGTLSMSLAQAQSAKMHITEGALKLTDAFSHTLDQTTSGRINYDLSGITSYANGVLQVDLNGTWNGTGLDATALALDAQFFGTLEVIDGQLLVKFGDAETDGKSDFGGARAIRLNKGALFFNADSSLDVAALEIAAENGYITNRSGLSTISSALSGSGNLTVQANGGANTIKLTGAVDLDGKLTNTSGTLTLESATKAQFDGGVLLSDGTININSAADISELTVTGGTFKINGAEVGVTTLKTGSALTLTGAAHLTAGLEDGSAVTLNGADTASATLTVAENGTANLQTGLVLDTLTVNAGGTLALNGAVTLDNLVNNAQLDLTNLTSLTLTGQPASAGAVITGLGSLTGLTNNTFHYGNEWLATYNSADGTATLSDNAMYWADAGAEGDMDINWSTASNWSGNAVPTTTQTIQLKADAAITKTLVLTEDTTVGAMRVYDAYNLSVADGATASFAATNGYTFVGDAASLTKTGDGILTMSSAQVAAAKMTVNEGTLAITDRTAMSQSITVNQGGTIRFDGDNTRAVSADIDGTGRVEVDFAASGAHGNKGANLGDGFNGTLALSGWFEWSANTVGSNAVLELSTGQAWDNGGTVSNNINFVGDSISDFTARSTGIVTLAGVLTGHFTSGIDNGTLVLSNTTSNVTVAVTNGTLQLGGNNLTAGNETGYFDGVTVNLTEDAGKLKTQANDGNATRIAGASRYDTAINVNANATVELYDGSTYFAKAINVMEGKKLTLLNAWDKNQFLSGIKGTNIDVTVRAVNQGSGNGGLRWVTLTGETGTFSGSLTLENKEENAAWQRGLNVTGATALQNVVVNFEAADVETAKGALLLFSSDVAVNNSSVNDATRANGTVAGLAGNKGRVYADTLTINTAQNAAYDYSGELHVNSLLKSGAGSQTLSSLLTAASVEVTGGELAATAGLNLSGALTLGAGTSAKLGGAVSLGSLSNAGMLDVSSVTSLAISDLEYKANAQYHVGNLVDADAMLALVGNGGYDYLTATYDATTGYITFADSSTITWDDPATDDGDHLWGTADNWSHDTALAETDVVALNGGEDVHKTIEFAADSTVAGIHVNDAYIFSVAESSEATLTVGEMVFGDGASITKAGAGKLTLATTLQSDSLMVNEGTLAVSTLTPASGTFTLSGAGRLETTALTANKVVVSEARAVMQAAGITLASGNTFTKAGAGTFELSDASGLLGKNMTVEAGKLHITQSEVNARSANGANFTITVNTGATLDDDRRLALTGGTVDITGGGVYEVDGICLSFGAVQVTTVNVADNTTLHITGTVTNPTGGDGSGSYGDFGSFMMSNWGATNVLNIEGKVISEAGISNRDGSGTINIENGGVLQMNKGLFSTNHNANKYVTIDVKGGGLLDVRGETTTNAANIHVTMQREAILMGGAGAGGNAKIANNLTFEDGAFIGAKAGSTLTLEPTADSMSIRWMDILGTTDTLGVLYGAGGTVAFAKAVTATETVKVLSGATAEFQAGLTVSGGSGLENYGTLTLNGANLNQFTNAANSSATFQGAISIDSMADRNAGTIDVAGATSLALGDFSLTDGATYTIGALTGLSDTHTIGSLLGAGQYHDVTYDGTSTVSVVSHLVWDAQSSTEGDNVWNTAADNLNWKVDTDTEKAFAADKVVVFAPNADAVNSTVALGEDVTAGEVRLLGAYTFQTDAARTLSGAVKLLADDAALTKSGAGTLTLTDAVALNTASALTVSEGEMKLEGGMVFANGIETFTKKGDGTLTLVFAEGDTTLKYVDLTVESGILNIEQSGESLHEYANSYTVMSGAVVNDERRMGSSDNLTFTGGGVYNVAGIALSREGYNTPCALTVESDTTLHITGTDVAGENGVATDGSGGAFLLGNFAANNTVNIRGTLISDAGLSNLNASPTINVENGGTLQLNAGLSGSNYNLNESTDVTLNVNSGGVLVVNSSNTTNTDRINVELGQATVFTTEGATIANDMSYNEIVSLGAAQNKTLSLTKDGQVNMYKLTILGTANAVNGVDAGGEVVFSSKVSGMGITLNEGAQFAADGGLNLLGALTLSSNALATLSGDVYVGSLENAGSLDVSGASSLSIGAIDFSVGQSYHVGTIVTSDTFTTDDFLALIGTGGDSSLKASYDATTGMLSFDSSIYWLDGTEADNTNSLWSSAENWSTGGEDSFTLAGVTVKLGAEATNRNVVLDSDVDANTTVHVAEAYTMTVQEGESHALNGRLEYAANDAAGLTKAGDGTLTMSLENATLGKGVHIADGTLEVLGTQTENRADGNVVAGGFAANGPHDLTAISADKTGTLSVKLYGNVNNSSFDDTTALTLSDDFRGTLEVTHGYLMIHYSDTMKTTLGGTTKIRLDGGGVALRDNDTLDTAIEVGADGAWLMGRNAGNEYSGDITGAGTLTLVSNWGGDDVLTLSGSITLGDYETADDQSNPITAHSSIVKNGGSVVYITGDDNNINITGGVTAQGSGQLVFQNKQTLNSLAINGGTVSLEKDATLGSMSMNAATLTVGTAATDEAEGTAATITITSEEVRANNHNANRTVTLNSGSVVNDAAQWQLTGGTFTLNGEGVYSVAGMKLSANQASATTLTIESGTTLHVTGETDHATQNNGSFVLAHWNSANTVNVAGKLALECGISTHFNYTSQSNIYVEDGGTIAFNQGLTAAGRDDAAIINIAGGGTLEVSGTDTTGTNLVTVNVADGAFIMGGNANGATGALIANNLVFNNGAYIGAKEGTTLTIAPEAGSMRINWLDIIGTDYGAGGKVVFGSDLSVGAALKILAGAEAEMQGNLTLTNVYGVANAGTLTLSGDVDAPTIGNTNTGELIFDGAGLITLDDAMSNEGLIRFTNVDDMRITLDALEVSGSYGGAMRKWQIISNTGTLEGWTKDAISLDHFILNGETLSLEGDEWDGYELGADGSLTLYQSYRYWDSAGEDSSLWDTESGTVWRDRTTMEGLTYEANSRVAFGEYEDGDDINGNPATLVELNKNVTVAEAGVLAKNLDVFGTGYVFEGGKITVTKALSIQQDATFNNTLVIGDATNALDINVDSGKIMTLNTLETLSTVKNGVLQYNAEGGSFRKTGEGILSITGAVAGVINSAAVEAGTLQLGDTVSLTVGANRITGGSLQNVVLSGAGTSISAFAEGSDAVLTDVQLNAGSSTAYATVQDVTFAGTSTLTGYITFEQTQSAQDMQVAAGGSLTISNLTLDLHGLAAGEKQIILNSATTEGLGSISNWDTVKLVYSGVAVNAGTVDLSTAGVVKIAEKGAALYWDGLADGSAAAIWNTTSTNWSAAAGKDGDSLFYALSDTYFGATPEGAAKEISLMQDVVMTNLFFTEGGYTINGSYRMATLGDVKITHDSGDVTINTTLVAQGNIVGSGAGHVIFGGDTTAVRDITLENAAVTVGADMEAQGNISIASKAVAVNAGTMSAAGDISIESGSSAAGDAGSFTLASGTGLSATNITIDVDGGAESDDHFQDVYVNTEGSINATGTLTITGSAAKAFAGAVAAGDVVVDQTGNKVTFDMLTTNTLTITQGSTAHLLNTGASIRSVQLAGTLGFEKFAGVYGGHSIVSTSADAAVSFATITSVTLASLSGDTLTTDADGNPLTYGSITFGTNYRNLTINRLSNIQNITIGAGEYGATFNNATGGIHGKLTLEGGKLTVNSANIMANGTGQWNISGNLVLGSNTQTLAGNTISLTNGFISGNATHPEESTDANGQTITINVRNQGLAYTADATINYGGESTISANMTLAADTTLTLQAAHATGQAAGGDSRSSADSLLLSGSLSGSAALLLQGDGVITVSGANADYNGTVTVGTESTLELANTAALSAATISVQDSGTLQLHAGGTVKVADLQLADGAALSIFGLAATDVPSLADAALLNTDAGISWVPNAEGNLTLHVLFDAELENMKTYNLFNDVQSLAASGVSLNVMHNGVALDASQYKVGYDADAKLVYIRTMLGNIWSGGSLLDGESFTGDGIWAQAANNTDGNWTGKNYTESQAAIFVDLSAEHDNQIVTVTLADEVAPGDVYFEADKTYYKLISGDGDATAGLAAGTNIHKAGSAYVYLGLANNSTMDNAIGNLDLQAGRIELYTDLAVQGDVFIGKTAELRAYDFSLVKEAYTAKGQFSNLTMTDDAIRGASAENRGTVTSTYAAGQDVLIEAKDGQSVLLENMYLQTNKYKDGGDALRGVTIGENVEVTGNYTLYGAMVFNNTLANSGTVTLDAAMTAEIGKLDYSFHVDEDGASWYTYQLVQGGTINGMNDLLVSDVTIGGVSLGTDGLADGVATYISNADGSITLSIGNYVLDENGNKVLDENGQAKVDGTIGVPQWDERWHDNTDEQPSLSRRYAGTDAAANVTFGEGIDGNAQYYWYSSVVSAANADKVNGTGDEVVATLSSASTGNRAAGGSSAASSGLEMWIFDRSGFDTVIGGQYTDSLNNGWKQTAATHVLVNSVYDGADDDTEVDQKTWVVGGSWNTVQTADSHVTIQNGNILNVVGGTYGANQEADSYVYVDGGTVYELFAGGYDAAKDASYYGNVENTYLSITGGTLGYHPEDDSVRKRVYGGSYYGDVSGKVQITVDGDAVITDLVGGGYHGTVGGNITMDLVSGTVTGSIDAAGIDGSTVNGNVQVNLYQGFNLAEIYGGKQSSSGATVNGTSTLHFAEADTAYDLTQKKVQGFSHFTLADGAMVKVSTDSGSLRDASGVLTIGGAGLVELVGGEDIGRNITLVDGATLWFNSDDAGNDFSTEDNRPTITATAGTTLEITGMPNNGQGLCFWVDLAGHGVDGKGAMYKGLSGAATVPTGKVALPRITLSDSASIGTDDNICVIEKHNNESELFLNGNTLTKLGDNALMLYNTTVKDNTNANAVVDGTIYVKEGTLSTGYGMRAAKTNIVVGADTLLDVTNTGTADAVVGALSGSGNVSLSNNLTLTTSATGSYGEGSDWMTQGADAYGQFSKDTGFAYGVYSGAVSGSMMLNIAGNGTQYLSGSESTFTGGVHLKESATLYLLGSTNGAATAAGSSSATSGVVGTGAIAWDSADATLYLGDGVRVYNNGTTNVAGSNMIIGVEAAPAGDPLTNYAGTHTSVVLNGVEYVEIATHNLYSISCDGLYADGTTYVAGSAINRDKMLLVTKTEWDAGTATVQGFSSGGYNEATYSGVLGGQANLVKVGLGTLVLDQKNSYTGSTTIEAGTLALKGWAQIGGSSSSAALNVVQTEGSTLMLAYDGTYEGEITGISNNIALSGTGDARWTTESRTGNATAALISDVGGNVTFSLTGNISGDGNLLHSGAGTLVLSGDSTYTGGTHATGGVVEVQSATGMGAGAVQFEADAALHATVEAGTTASRLTTTLDEPGSYVKGKVNITGTDATERVLSVNTAGYTATNTTVDANGTLLVNGAGVQAATGTLGGTGKLVVSDASASGAKATVGALTEFTGDMVVEGNKAAIEVANGNYSGGSISISGQDAKLTTAGNVNIAYGEKLELKSNGSAASGDDNTAAALSAAAVNVAAGGTLSVSNSGTSYRYNLAGLQQAASAAVNEMLDSGIAGTNMAMGNAATTDYTYHFDSSRALNAQTAGMVEGGLTLNSDSRYEERQANISLAGGALTLNTADGKIALDLLTNGNVQTYDDGYTSQIVLFSGVSSLTLDGTPYGEANAIMMMAAADGEDAAASNTIYSTLASNYFTGWNITDQTYLVYDVGAGVVYLDKAVPEPTTTTLSILALAALVARRRRK